MFNTYREYRRWLKDYDRRGDELLREINDIAMLAASACFHGFSDEQIVPHENGDLKIGPDEALIQCEDGDHKIMGSFDRFRELGERLVEHHLTGVRMAKVYMGGDLPYSWQARLYRLFGREFS